MHQVLRVRSKPSANIVVMPPPQIDTYIPYIIYPDIAMLLYPLCKYVIKIGVNMYKYCCGVMISTGDINPVTPVIACRLYRLPCRV